jgi:uncharacterized protein (UPF0210 family)
MKIRTITLGCELNTHSLESQITDLAIKAHEIKDKFIAHGYEVQTIRISTQPWEQYIQKTDDLPTIVEQLQAVTQDVGFDYFNIGPTHKSSSISDLYEVLKNSTTGFCTSIICQNPHIHRDTLRETALLIQKLSTLEKQGFANLRFAALCNIPPGTPFYPASYHQGPCSFSIGLENSDLVYQSFAESRGIIDAEKNLLKTLEKEYKKIERLALQSSKTYDITYGGLDGSISSSVKENESIAYAFEHLNTGKFGDSGSCTIAKIITDVLQQVKIKKTGYNGLMLPVLEDHGLGKRNQEETYSIQKLLLYSSVCGTGLDTIPLPGNVTTEELCNILYDVSSLSQRLHKPLSVRLLPIPAKKTGDLTEFNFEYFVNTTIMKPS